MKCATCKEYHMAYLKCDVLLLDDVFEKLQEDMHELLQAGPNQLFNNSIVSMECSAITDQKLYLISNINMLNMLEKMKRGGLCFAGSQRYVQANNQHMEHNKI